MSVIDNANIPAQILDSRALLRHLKNQELMKSPVYRTQASGLGFVGDLLNKSSDYLLSRTEDDLNVNDIQDRIYGDTWGDIFTQGSRRQEINNAINNNIRTFDDVRNNANLSTLWDNNDYQLGVNKLTTGEQIGAVGTGIAGGAAKWASTAAKLNPALIAPAAVLGGVFNGIKSLANVIQGNNTADMTNMTIDRANNMQLNNYFDQAKSNRRAMYRNFDEGGPMESLNGLTFFNTGGTHGSNPLGGIPQGVDSEGVPNLVEQGEVKYNDYIFSSRNKINERLLNKYNLPKNLAGKTFAEVATKLQEESQERPYDPVSVNGLEDSMNKLMAAQEEVRAKKDIREQRNAAKQFAIGGNLYNSIPPVEEDEQELLFSVNNPWLARHLLYTNLNSYTPQTTELTTVSNKSTTPDNKQASKTKDDKKRDTKDHSVFTPSHLRYFPAASAALQALTDQLGITNRPDYYVEQGLRRNASELNPIAPKLNTDYQEYRPYDVNVMNNQLLAQEYGAQRAARENFNKHTQATQLLALNNAFGNTGFLANLQAQQANDAKRNATLQWNHGINRENAATVAAYDELNQGIKQQRLNMLNQAIQAKDASDTARGQVIGTNRTNAANQIGKVGLDATNFELQRILGQSDAYGVLNEALLNFINSQLGGRG